MVLADFLKDTGYQRRRNQQFRLGLIEGNSFLQRIQCRGTIATAAQMIPDHYAGGLIKVLVKLFNQVPIDFDTFHSLFREIFFQLFTKKRARAAKARFGRLDGNAENLRRLLVAVPL